MEDFLASYGNQILSLSWEYLYISAAALLLGILEAVPLVGYCSQDSEKLQI